MLKNSPDSDIMIFLFLKMVAGTILDFLNSQFLLACEIWRVELHQCATCHQNWSILSGHITVFLLFKMSATNLEFQKFLNFIGWRGSKGRDASFCQISSNFVNRLQSYCDFSIFQDSGRPPSLICLGHIRTTYEGYLVVFITVQNLVTIDAIV